MKQLDVAELNDFATRYAAAWSNQDPAAFASFYAKDGSLTVNDGEPSRGRDAVEETARAFMMAFPDMVVSLEEVRQESSRIVFHWHWTGTNTGPGGTGNAVNLFGYEEWVLDGDGLIVQSLGHYDDAEYQRQLSSTDTSLPDPLKAGWKGKPVCEKLHEDLDNRVLRCIFPPAIGHERHYHSKYFGYAITGSRVEITDATGTREVDLAAGSSFASKGVAWHEVLNIGDSTLIYLIVEPK